MGWRLGWFISFLVMVAMRRGDIAGADSEGRRGDSVGFWMGGVDVVSRV